MLELCALLALHCVARLGIPPLGVPPQHAAAMVVSLLVLL